GQEDHRRRARDGVALEEDLFGFLAAQLRRLQPYRACVEPVLERALNPLALAAAAPEGEDLRVTHLAALADLLHRHGCADPAAVTLHLYWALFTGVLAFWSRDASPHQEESLAVLD